MEKLANEKPLWSLLSLGHCPYEEAALLQRRILEKLKKRPYNGCAIAQDYMILSQFHPVITKGRRYTPSSLLFHEDELRRRGVSLCEADRGGDVTFHGPGQLVIYPVADLCRYGKDLHHWMRLLEESVLHFLRCYGVEGQRNPGFSGVWVGDKKIASIGVGCSQWISTHGIGLNISTDLAFFEVIVPCGLKNVQMTSLAMLLGHDVDMAEAEQHFVKNFLNVVGGRL